MGTRVAAVVSILTVVSAYASGATRSRQEQAHDPAFDGRLAGIKASCSGTPCGGYVTITDEAGHHTFFLPAVTTTWRFDPGAGPATAYVLTVSDRRDGSATGLSSLKLDYRSIKGGSVVHDDGVNGERTFVIPSGSGGNFALEAENTRDTYIKVTISPKGGSSGNVPPISVVVDGDSRSR